MKFSSRQRGVRKKMITWKNNVMHIAEDSSDKMIQTNTLKDSNILPIETL